jgi:hypothetical protein
MDGKALAEYIDNQRWLMNNGLLNDGAKNQLFVYGSIVHKDVEAVELHIDVATKKISYEIYVGKVLLNKIEKYKKLSTSKSFFEMWRFKRLLEKEGNLNFQHVLGRFVKDFCGPSWTTEVTIIDAAKYVEGYKDSGDAEFTGDNAPDQQPDGR